MTLIELPKFTHPDFADPSKKPSGAVKFIAKYAERIHTYWLNSPERQPDGAYWDNFVAQKKSDYYAIRQTESGYFRFDHARNFNGFPFVIVADARFPTANDAVYLFGSVRSLDDYDGVHLERTSSNIISLLLGDGNGGGGGDRRSFVATEAVADTDGFYKIAIEVRGLTDATLFINGKEVALTTSGSASSINFNSVASSEFNGAYIGRRCRSNDDFSDIDVRSIFCMDGAVGKNELRSLSIQPYRQIFNPAIPQSYFIAEDTGGGSPITVMMGQSTETDSGFEMTLNKVAGVGQSNEADSATEFTLSKLATIAQGIETESATQFSTMAYTEIGLGVETDSAHVISPQADIIVNLAIANETDSAFVLSTLKRLAISQASETDSATQTPAQKLAALTQAIENSSAFEIVFSSANALGLATENSLGLAFTIYKLVEVGLVSETDISFSISPDETLIVNLGLSQESDSAFAMDSFKQVGVALSSETNIALGVRATSLFNLNMAIETNTANSVLLGQGITINQSSESDSAFLVDLTKLVTTGMAQEFDSAFGVTYPNLSVTMCGVTMSLLLNAPVINFQSDGVEVQHKSNKPTMRICH